MPNDPKVWMLLIVVAGIVLLLALWFGRGIRARFGKTTIDVQARQEPRSISVAQNAELNNVKGGDIAGIKSSGKSVPSPTENIDVLKGGKVSESQIGDIVGIKEGNTSGQQDKRGGPNKHANRT